MPSHLKDIHDAIKRGWPHMTRSQRRDWLKENMPDYYKKPEDKTEQKGE